MTDHGMTRALGSRSRANDGSKFIGIRGTAYLHRRMMDAARADGLTVAELLSSLLDLRERDQRRRASIHAGA